MTPERWGQIKQILIGWEEQQDLDDYLDACCGTDLELRREVCSYFEADSDPLEELGSLVRETIADQNEASEGQDFLGEGPTGRVFRFYDAAKFDGRPVALKKIPCSRLAHHDPPSEILDLPELLPLLEVRKLEFEVLFFSELAVGPGLDDFCRQNADRPCRLLATFRHICQMVAKLHDRGLAPGNIKPGNIRFDHEGRLRLSDMQCALHFRPLPPARRIATEYGPAWQICESISPEQLQGGPPGTASDVFALGLLFYRVMCGAYPYTLQEVSSEKARRLVLVDAPPVISSFFGLPASSDQSVRDRNLTRFMAEGGLDLPIAKALAKNENDRFGHAGGLLAAIDALLPTGLCQSESPVELPAGNPGLTEG